MRVKEMVAKELRGFDAPFESHGNNNEVHVPVAVAHATAVQTRAAHPPAAHASAARKAARISVPGGKHTLAMEVCCAENVLMSDMQHEVGASDLG